MMAFVLREFELEDVPARDRGRGFGSSEGHVVASDSSEELSDVGSTFRISGRFPISELPVISIDENSYHTLPFGLAEVSH